MSRAALVARWRGIVGGRGPGGCLRVPRRGTVIISLLKVSEGCRGELCSERFVGWRSERPHAGPGPRLAAGVLRRQRRRGAGDHVRDDVRRPGPPARSTALSGRLSPGGADRLPQARSGGGGRHGGACRGRRPGRRAHRRAGPVLPGRPAALRPARLRAHGRRPAHPRLRLGRGHVADRGAAGVVVGALAAAARRCARPLQPAPGGARRRLLAGARPRPGRLRRGV